MKTNILNNTFEHNGPVENVVKTSYGRFVIHSGGLSIGTYILDQRAIIGQDTPSIVIQQCTFVNNSAIPNDEVQLTLTEVFISEWFNGRGGGLGIVLNSPLHPYNVIVSNCTFVGNKAKLLGGGIYFTSGRGTSQNITLDCNVITENHSTFAGGGTFIGAMGPGTLDTFNRFVFNRCQYIGNTANSGGGAVYAVPSDQG